MEKIREKRHFLVGEVAKMLIADTRRDVPATGRFPAKQYRMVYPGSRHDGLMGIYYSESTGCTVQVGIIVEGTDMLIKNFAFFGSRDECLAWLEKPETVDEMVQMMDNLAIRADEE